MCACLQACRGTAETLIRSGFQKYIFKKLVRLTFVAKRVILPSFKMEQGSREKKENTKENQSLNKKVFDDAHCAFLCLKPGKTGLLFFSSTENDPL